MVEEKVTAIKELSNRLEGYYTCTRFLLERINSNLFESQVSGIDGHVDAYEIKICKLVGRIDLLENNSNQYLNK